MKTILQTFLGTLAAGLCWQAQAQIYDTNNEVVQNFVGSQFYGFYDGQGLQTMFYNPSRVVADTIGNLFVLDNGNYRIRKITPGGMVSTFAGGGSVALVGPGTNVNLGYGFAYTFNAMTIDHSDTLWLTIGSASALLRIGSDSFVSQIPLPIPQTPPAVRPTSCNGLCVDSGNNIYISDSTGNRIFRYNANGTLEVFAGSGDPGTVDGNWIFTSFQNPTALACDAADNIYVFQSSSPYSYIRRVNQNRDVVTIAGGAYSFFGNLLDRDGVGTNASFFHPIMAMCADNSGDIILACGGSVRMVTAATNVTTLAGSFSLLGFTNGAGDIALFNAASGVCFSQGSIFVTDTQNQRIRQITYNPSLQVVPPASLQLNTYPALQITGTVGRTYQIQTSTDMNNWNTVATILLTSRPFLWPDQNALIGNKFYRALLIP